MAKIFGIEGGSQVPSLSEAIQPTLDIPLMQFDSIAKALENYSAFEQNDIANAEENFNNITEFRDKLLNEKFDNERQKDVFEKARQDVGIGDDAFRMSLSDLRDNYKMRDIRSKTGQIYERADVQNIFHEQLRSKDYLDKIYSLKDMNPSLYKKALSKYNQYRNGEISGFDLLPQEFQPIDVTSAIAESLKLVPQIETSDIKTKSGLAYEQIVKQRSRQAIDSVIGRLNNNAAFKNNLEAMFTDANGNYNKDAANAYVDQMASEYAKQYIDIENVKEIKSTKPEDQPLQNVMDDASKLGADPNELMKNKTILQQAVEGKKILRIDRDEESVNITYLGPDEKESVISIPRIGNTSTEPIRYNMSVNGETKQLTKESINSYIAKNPKVVAKGFFHQFSENEGQKTEGYFKDGKFYTNDINMLYQLGIVPKGTDFNDLDKKGFKVTETPDGKYLAEIPVSSDKAKTSFPDVYVPNAKNIESKLDSSSVISQYPKDGEKYNIAKMFLASPEIQDKYFEQVFMNEDYQDYLNTVEAVAPMQDNGKRDISKVNDSLKPLLKDNTDEKLEYLAYHHAYKSGGFLKEGNARFPGNPKADEQLKAQWAKIDEIMKDNPGLPFPELLKKLESDSTYDAVNPSSSAIGKYQILFDKHYDKIKQFVIDNIDKVPRQMEGDGGKPAATTDETVKDTTPVSPIFEDYPQDTSVAPQDTVKKKVTDVPPIDTSAAKVDTVAPKVTTKPVAPTPTKTPTPTPTVKKDVSKLGPVGKQDVPAWDFIDLSNKITAKETINKVSQADPEAAKNPLVFASKYLGVNEADPIQQETIKGFLNTAVPGFIKDKGEVTKDTAAWCAAFVNSVLNEGSFKGLDTKDNYDKLKAKNYMSLGDPIRGLREAKPGDIIVIKHKDGSGYHVGFYAGEKDGEYLLLGGNQRNAVNITKINPDKEEIASIRRVNDIEDVSPYELNKIVSTKYYNKD
jgi:uncharacterized protein (TIGR02594 family)